MMLSTFKRHLFASASLLILLTTINSWAKPIEGSVEWVCLKKQKAYALQEVLYQSQPQFAIAVQQKGYTLDLDLQGFWKQAHYVKGSVYEIVNLPGWESQTAVGKPAVPMKPVFVELPIGASYTVKVVDINSVEMPLAAIWPTQPAVPQDLPPPPFTKDNMAYSQNALYPKSPIISTHEVWMRDHRILEIQVAPIRYNPVTGVVNAATKLTIEVTLNTIGTNQVSALHSATFDQTMIEGLPSVLQPKRIPMGKKAPLAKYMILLDDQFSSNAKLAEFVDWKKRRGNDVVIVKTSDINSNGSPQNSEITSYMRNLPDKDYPVYLLIIGMDSRSNGVEPYMYQGKTPSDLRFACKTSSDFLPDLFYARLPASNNSELRTMLEKVMDMDRNPPQSNMYQKVLMAGQIQDNEGQKNVCDRMHCETSDAIACYFEQDAGGVDYSCVRAITNPHSARSDCLWRNDSRSMLWRNVSGNARKIGRRVHDHFINNSTARSRINNSINNGVSIIQHRDHGYVKGWGNPSYSSSNLRSGVDNGKNRPIVFSNNCLSGSYHRSDSFIKAWMTHAKGGAYAYVGCTNVSSWGWNDYVCHGKFIAFLGDWRSWHSNSQTPDWTTDLAKPDFGGEGKTFRLGPIMNFAKLYMYQRYGSSSSCERHTNLFHLFGDPEAFIQLLKPKSLTVSFPDTIPIDASKVTVDCGVNDATVCLYGPDINVHQVATSANGKASFDIDPSKEGDLFVTVAGYGLRPFEGKALARNISINIVNHLATLKHIMNRISLVKSAKGYQISIPTKKDLTLSLYDLRGRKRISLNVTKEQSIYTISGKDLSAGLFLLDIKSGTKRLQKSIVVQ